jgi:hypothetical protein
MMSVTSRLGRIICWIVCSLNLLLMCGIGLGLTRVNLAYRNPNLEPERRS